MTENTSSLWVKGYTADGYQVGITVAVDPANLAQWITDALTAIREAGIRPRELGTEAGEDVHTLDFVVRRTKYEDDGSETPLIDLYSSHLPKHRVIGLYLNNAEMVAEFERVTGLRVNDLRNYESKAPLPKEDNMFPKYAAAVPNLPQYAVKKNPRWDDSKSTEENMKAKATKHLFTRWLGAGAPAPVAESKSERLAREIDDERPAHLKPDNPVLSGNQFVATRIQKKTKEDKSWYLLFSEDQQTFASSWGLSKYEIFSDEDRAEFEDGAEHFITPIVVTWKADGKFKKVTGMTPTGEEFQGLTF